MFLEMILAVVVAHSAHRSAEEAASGVIGAVDAAAVKVERHLSVVEKKVDQLHVKMDTNQVRLMRALTWHDYVQTLHVKGAKYKGDELYVLKERRTVTTANLATKVVKEVNGSFVLYKSFNDDTERLYADTILVYERMGGGEIRIYDDYGRLHMHTNQDRDTYYYRPDGKTQSIRWSDGAVWYYKYDDKGNVEEVEAYGMTPTSRRPPVSQAAVRKWRECAQKHSVPACVNRCNDERGAPEYNVITGMMTDNGCFNECKGKQTRVCGSMPRG